MNRRVKMLLTLNIILSLILIFHNCAGDEELEEANELYSEHSKKNKELYKEHNIPESDYQYFSNMEIFPPNDRNDYANILLEYQHLLKKDERCKRKTFKDCLREFAERIPKKYKCPVQSVCDCHAKYSRVDGSCNNLKFPNLGKAPSSYDRMLDSYFSDGINALPLAVSGNELPNPRVMGNLLAKGPKFIDPQTCGDHINNFASVIFCQLVAHDIGSRKVVTVQGNNKPGARCCKEDLSGPLPPSQINPSCIPVPLPDDDPFYSQYDIKCQNFMRMQSSLNINCSVVFEQENESTSFLDLDIIYAVTDQETRQMRANHSGLFNLSPGDILPIVNGNLTAGDFRFRQTPILAIIHSLFYRFHNKIAKELKKLNPCWDDEKLFLESRRISIACYQYIIYDEWLPLVLGKKRWLSYKLNSDRNSDKYNSRVIPTTTMEFTHCAFRRFHMNVAEDIFEVDDNGKLTGKRKLSDTFNDLAILQTHYNSFLLGTMFQKQRMDEVGYDPQVRNLLLKNTFRGGDKVGSDLLLFDIMRNRDSATLPYIKYFPFCGEKEIKCWDDLKPYFDEKHIELLKKMYESVFDIELLIGIHLEQPCGNEFGIIGGCIVAEQYNRFKFGDRFFFSHINNPYKFTDDQLDQIENITFSKFICMSTDLKLVPQQGLISISKKNPYVDCCKVQPIDFSPFKVSSSSSSSSPSSSSPPSSPSSSSACH